MKKALHFILYAVLFIGVFAGSAYIAMIYHASTQQRIMKVDWNDSVGTVYSDLRYGDGEYHTYSLYMPANLDKNQPQSLILDIHGGGFTAGDKTDDDAVCRYYASKGLIVAAMNYTYLGVDGASLNSMMEEALQCVDAVREQCASMGYHVTEMATTGSSAGGCLAMLYAYRNAKESSIPVKFVFQQTGPATFDKEFWGDTTDNYEMQALSASLYTGKTIVPESVGTGEYQQYVDEISPAALISDTTVPTLCAYGPKDKIIPTQLKYLLFNNLAEHHIPYDYIEFPHSNHGMYDDPDKTQEYLAKSLEYCERYFENYRKQ